MAAVMLNLFEAKHLPRVKTYLGLYRETDARDYVDFIFGENSVKNLFSPKCEKSKKTCVK